MKPKNQRLVLLVAAIVAVIGAVLLAMSGLRDRASFFYAPDDVAQKGLPLDRAVRIGGMVRPGSIVRHADGVTIDFVVTDDTPNVINVTYRGITPDLFREGSGSISARPPRAPPPRRSTSGRCASWRSRRGRLPLSPSAC
jgi:cytochrome c-type biogenesis protein CcmE